MLGWLQVVGVAKDQNGCRFLQRKFEEGGAAAIAAVFPEILDNLIELMVDPFGNYLIQKLLDRCSEEQRLQVKAAYVLVSVVNVQSGHHCECEDRCAALDGARRIAGMDPHLALACVCAQRQLQFTLLGNSLTSCQRQRHRVL